MLVSVPLVPLRCGDKFTLRTFFSGVRELYRILQGRSQPRFGSRGEAAFRAQRRTASIPAASLCAKERASEYRIRWPYSTSGRVRSCSSGIGKCLQLPVTRVRRWSRAIAAMVMSGRAIVCPFFNHSFFRLAGAAGDFPRHFIKFEASQERFCNLNFVGAHNPTWSRPRLPCALRVTYLDTLIGVTLTN